MSVVEFKPRAAVVAPTGPVMWQCKSCQGQHFWLYAEGEVECVGCGVTIANCRVFNPTEAYSG